MGSASNPIIINFDNDCSHHVPWEYHSDGDKEVLATPDFWENLIDESFPKSPNEEAVIDQISDPTLTISPIFQNSGQPQFFGLPTTDCAHDVLNTSDAALNASRDCSTLGVRSELL